MSVLATPTRTGPARSRAPLAVLVALLVAAHLVMPVLTFTGDEPRYALVGLGLAGRGQLEPSRATWDGFLARSGLPNAPYSYDAKLMHPAQALGPGVAFGPSLLLGGLAGGRWTSFVVGCVGLFALWELLGRFLERRTVDRRWVRIATIGVCAFSLPLAAYLGLMYPETLLFTSVTVALLAFVDSQYLAVSLVAGLLPFCHLRGLPISFAIEAMVLVELTRFARARRLALRSALLFAGIVALWAIVQVHAYGRLTGGAFYETAPQLGIAWQQFGLQLFGVRHGLLAYSPVFLLGAAGLVAGMLARDRFCAYCAFALTAYVLGFMWAWADESWTARFWVAALPFLAVGLAYWLGRARGIVAAVVASPLVAITAANAILFVREPDWFLENRGTSLTYARIATIAHVNLGASLPLDNVGSAERAATAESVFVLLSATAVALVVLVWLTKPLSAVESAP